MANKKIYLGQDFSVENCTNGLGSIYLAGPYPKTWISPLVKKLDKSLQNVTIFIPDYPANTKYTISRKETFQWQETALSMVSIISFWFPSGNITDATPYIDFGRLLNTERVFLGIEDKKHNQYLEYLFYKTHQLYPSDSMDNHVEMIAHWFKE
jgi:hypothetical protein